MAKKDQHKDPTNRGFRDLPPHIRPRTTLLQSTTPSLGTLMWSLGRTSTVKSPALEPEGTILKHHIPYTIHIYMYHILYNTVYIYIYIVYGILYTIYNKCQDPDVYVAFGAPTVPRLPIRQSADDDGGTKSSRHGDLPHSGTAL